MSAGAMDRTRIGLAALWALAVLLCVAGLFVRGLGPSGAHEPRDAGPERPRIRAPLQFLGPGARERIAELDPHVSERWRAIWRASREILFHLEGCPRLHAWKQGVEGQRLERLVVELRAGSEEDALAALALIFELARRTDWQPGLRGHGEHAEVLGSLLQAWLKSWGERGVDDALLHEPALAAGLLYGAVMRVAWRAPLVGRDEAPYARATSFLEELCGLAPRARTAYGRALQARYPRAWTLLEGREDRLRGLTEEAAALSPELSGGCKG